ncbi:MAG TPA: GNAT family N-acetyltransferase [Planctomycetota bacterium]|nr:GNAT family N-acetyltransferase [Planctomycetota bacterium]
MNDETCTIREADPADVPGAAVLYRAFLEETVWSTADGTPNPKLDVEYLLTTLVRAENSDVLVAEVDGKPVGFACVHFRPGMDRSPGLWARFSGFFSRKRRSAPLLFPDQAYLAYLFVAAEVRRHGIATALVTAAGEWARRRGAKSLDLNVLAENADARALYRKLDMSEFLIHYRMRL